MTLLETEAAVESAVEREMDRLDKRYLRGEVTEAEYEATIHGMELRARRTMDRAKSGRRWTGR